MVRVSTCGCEILRHSVVSDCCQWSVVVSGQWSVWPVVSGQWWPVVSDHTVWPVASGQWSVVSGGQWPVVSGQWWLSLK